MIIYAENLKQVMIKLMTLLQSEYFSLTSAKPKDETRNRRILDYLGKGIWALYQVAYSEHTHVAILNP